MSTEPTTTGNKSSTGNHKTKPTARQIIFAQLIAKGETQTAAYRRIYKPNAKPRHAVEAASRIAALPAVAAEIARVQALITAKTLLSINDQLAILARDAQLPDNSAAMVGARARTIKTYAEIAGNVAPTRQELSGPGGGPIPLVSTAGGSIGRKERVGLWREGRKAARAVPVPAEAPAVVV